MPGCNAGIYPAALEAGVSCRDNDEVDTDLVLMCCSDTDRVQRRRQL